MSVEGKVVEGKVVEGKVVEGKVVEGKVVELKNGRPRATSRRALELVAMQLFRVQGFDETTVEQISELAGISRRTFFRYFDSKTAVLWSEFDREVLRLRAILQQADPQQSIVGAVRQAVLTSNHYADNEIAELRLRMQLIATMPNLAAGAVEHYDAWVNEICDFAADRLGVRPGDLIPRAIGLSALAVCRAAFDEWVRRPDSNLQDHLDTALTAWINGFLAC